MGVVVIDGRVTVVWTLAVATLTAPTVAEATAGTRLEGLINPDGLDIKNPTGKVDISNLGSTKNAYRAGRGDPDIMITAHHDGSADTLWNLMTYRANGYLLVRPGTDKATAYAAAQKWRVFQVEAGYTEDVKPGPDGRWDFSVPLMVIDFEDRAVMA